MQYNVYIVLKGLLNTLKMKKKTNNIVKIIILFLLLFIVVETSDVPEQNCANNTRIHFISLFFTTDAILLESDGHFGMVDSGEDWDYPNNHQYPLRSEVTTNYGYDQQVIHYLKDVCGVKKLDFYIATHSHSDHIGTADEIMDEFPIDRLYINRYDDSYISSTDYLWDNQYVYDCLINKAIEKNVQIITDLDLEKNAIYRNFTMGEMKISIMNYERDRDTCGNIIPVKDENYNSLTVLVQAYGKNAFLSSDIEHGDTAKLANQLVAKLWDTVGVDKNEADLHKQNIASYDVVDNKGNKNETEEIDEFAANSGKKIQLDLLKLPHHGVKRNYSRYFLTSLNPKNVIVTGPISNFDSDMKKDLPNAQVYSTQENAAAIVADFSTSGLNVNLKKTESGYYFIDDQEYFFDNCARLSGWNHLKNDSKWYFFINGNKTYGWLDVDGNMYYMDNNGAMQTGWQYIDDQWYYMNASGAMTTGWQYVGGQWYYMNTNGTMAVGWQYIDGQWYYLNQDGTLISYVL